MRVSVVRQTGRRAMEGEVLSIEEITVELTKDANCLDARMQVGISGLEFHVDLN